MGMNIETLLERNSDFVVDSEFDSEVIAFIQEHESVAGMRTVAIKQLTKAAKARIWSKHPEDLKGFDERLYNYHVEGLASAERNAEGLALRVIEPMQSHLNTHAGEMACKFYYDGKGIEWAEKAYAHFMAAPKFNDMMHTLYAKRSALALSMQVVKKTLDPKWLERAVELSKDPIVVNFEGDICPERVFKELFEDTKEASIGKKWFEAVRDRPANPGDKPETKYWAIAKAAECIYDAVEPPQKEEWADEVFKNYMEFYKSSTQSYALSAIKFAGKVYRETKSDKWRDNYRRAQELSSELRTRQKEELAKRFARARKR